MRTEIIALNYPATDALLRHASVRLQSAVERFQWRLVHATMRLTDANAHKGGVDQRCMIEVRLRRGGTLTVEEFASDAYAAVDLATTTLKRVLAREIRKQWEARHDLVQRRRGQLTLPQRLVPAM